MSEENQQLELGNLNQQLLNLAIRNQLQLINTVQNKGLSGDIEIDTDLSILLYQLSVSLKYFYKIEINESSNDIKYE